MKIKREGISELVDGAKRVLGKPVGIQTEIRTTTYWDIVTKDPPSRDRKLDKGVISGSDHMRPTRGIWNAVAVIGDWKDARVILDSEVSEDF